MAFNGLGALKALSINHRTCGLPGLAGVSAGADGARAVHGALTARGVASVVLATCNRTEVYWRATNSGDGEAAMDVLARVLETPAAALAQQSVSLEGEAVAAHLFRVCCGLESLVLGEAEILGQARSAVESCPSGGPFLHGVFRAAIRAGRAARAETGIGTGAMSVASTAIHWLQERLALRHCRVLIIGAGHTGEKVARHLRAIGVGGLVISNRTLAHAEAVASGVGGDAVPIEELSAEILRADVVIAAVNTPGWILSLGQIRQRLAERPSPLVVVDLSMPPCVESGACDGLIRVDLSVIEQTAVAHRHQREAEIPGVEAVIARELDFLREWARHEALRPLVADLRQTADRIRRDELVRAQAELQRSPDAGPVLERFSRRLFDRMLALPIDRLKAGEIPPDMASGECLRCMFALDGRPPS